MKSRLTFILAQGIDGDLVDSSNFPLLNLRHILRRLSLALHGGRGFCVIKGLDYDKYSVEDNMIIFLGVQSYIAETRARQDEKGNMIGVYKTLMSCNSPDDFDSAHYYRRYRLIESNERISYQTF